MAEEQRSGWHGSSLLIFFLCHCSTVVTYKNNATKINYGSKQQQQRRVDDKRLGIIRIMLAHHFSSRKTEWNDNTKPSWNLRTTTKTTTKTNETIEFFSKKKQDEKTGVVFWICLSFHRVRHDCSGLREEAKIEMELDLANGFIAMDFTFLSFPNA